MTIDTGTADLDSARRAKLAEALVQAGRGDRNAFATVYAATSAKLLGVCLRIFPDRNEAEDVLQDAYLTIWNKAASFESGRASPISWLVAVTRNRAIDRLRAKKKAGTTSIEEAADIADATPLADARLIEEAEGYKARVTATAEGDAMRFKQILVEYAKAPQVTRDRMYVDTMREVYTNVSKILVDTAKGNNMLYLPLDKIVSQVTAESNQVASQATGSVTVNSAGDIPTTTRAPERTPDRRDGGLRSRDRDVR